jgi:hypothetical protein
MQAIGKITFETKLIFNIQLSDHLLYLFLQIAGLQF